MNRIPDNKRLVDYFRLAEQSAEYFYTALQECKDDELYIRQLFYSFKANYDLVYFIEHEIEGAFIAEYGDVGSRFRQRMDKLRQFKVRLCSSYYEYREWCNKNLIPQFEDDLPF